jgi:hypothetical protein
MVPVRLRKETEKASPCGYLLIRPWVQSHAMGQLPRKVGPVRWLGGIWRRVVVSKVISGHVLPGAPSITITTTVIYAPTRHQTTCHA